MNFGCWSLRAKLTLWSAVVVAATVLLAGAGTAYFLQEERVASVDHALSQDAKHFFKQFREHRWKLSWINPEEMAEILPSNSQPARFVEITGPGGALLFRSANVDERFRNGPARLHTRSLGRQRVRIGTFSKHGVTLRIGRDLNTVEDLTRELLSAYAVALPLVLAAAALGGWWLARQALEPVRAIASAAERITARELGLRLPSPLADDEIGRLAGVLNTTFERLEVSFRQARRFSADASHELKTPLTVLRSGIEDLLRSPGLRAEDARALSSLLEQTRGLSSITESLLLLSRADAGRLRLDLRPANVCEIVAACVEDAGIMAEGRRVAFEVEMPEEAFAPVDRGRLTQILLNLLDNAVKYNRENGKIRVRVTSRRKALFLSVANTGPGIPAASATRLFERFHRADPTADIPGHGLGLSLARELARAHDGDLSLTRTDSEWTEFLLRLPAADSSREPKIAVKF